MINRAAVILKYKAPAVQWINDADPYEDDPGITLESVNQERPVYLISDKEAEHERFGKWVRKNFEEIFETELEGWYTDESLWPEKRTIKLFREWFEIECHSIVLDMSEEPLFDEEDL